MRVLIPFVGDSFGGSHRSVIELVKGLRKREIDAYIVVHQPDGPLASVLENEGVPYWRLPAKRFAGESPSRLKILLGVVQHFRRLRKYIRSNAVDVVHGNDLRINLTWSLPARMSGVKFVWHQRTVLSRSGYWRLIPYLCDQFIAISRFVFDSAPAAIPECRKNLVFNPFDTSTQCDRRESREWLVRKYDLPDDSVILGYLGRLVPWKNVPLLLAGFARLVHSVEAPVRVHLLIVGTGRDHYRQYLDDIVFGLDIKESVTFAGFSQTPLRVLAGLDIAVMPSVREPFGRTVVEAMIQRTPVIAARAGGHEESIEDGVNGVLYEPESVEDFVRRIVPLIREPAMRKRLAVAAYADAVRRYGVERHVDAIMAIYNGQRNS